MTLLTGLPGFSLSSLGLKIFEALVTAVVSGPVYTALSAPITEKQAREKLSKAAINAEKKFAQNFTDKEVCEALFVMPIADLPSFQIEVMHFYHNHTADQLSQYLTKQLIEISPHFSSKRIAKAVSSYIYFLEKEILIFSEEFRKLSDSVNTLEINRSTTGIAEDIHEMKKMMKALSKNNIPIGLVPPRPDLLLGRENDLSALKNRMGINGKFRRLIVVRGLPGVGKTTLIARLAHDPEVAQIFPDGILWAALGQSPQIRGELFAWGRALHCTDIRSAENIEEAANQLTAVLRGKRMLLLIDDVWESAHGRVFQIAGENSMMLFSTRLPNVASSLVSIPDDIYRLDKLSDENAFELLRALAPGVARDYSSNCFELIQELEGLPLSIQIAGRLLEADYTLGLPVMDRIEEIRSGKILTRPAPLDRMMDDGVTPTLASLLKTSTDALDPYTRDCFACLADFAPKPARFHLHTLARVWEVDDPVNIVKTLVGRGLLEPAGNGYFQMHSILVWQAKDMRDHN